LLAPNRTTRQQGSRDCRKRLARRGSGWRLPFGRRWFRRALGVHRSAPHPPRCQASVVLLSAGAASGYPEVRTPTSRDADGSSAQRRCRRTL